MPHSTPHFPFLTSSSPNDPPIQDRGAIMLAATLNNEGLALERNKSYGLAETKYLEALDAKIKGAGVDSSQAALTTNALGELYLATCQLEKAQEMLEHAERVRSSIAADLFDLACTRDNLGRLWEMKGDLLKAREWRTKGESHQMICSSLECGKSQNCQFSDRDELRRCGKCKCAFYCNLECQKQDWRRHKVFYHEPQAA